MKILILFTCGILTGCHTPRPTSTAPTVAALDKVKASTAAAVADNQHVGALARAMGKGVVEMDGRLHRASGLNRIIDDKAVQALEILDRYK
jgi:hypothetical protein